MKPILEIQNISKKFRINHEKHPYLSLRDRFTNLFKSDATTEDFWALKDVSFEVMPGDTIGIIGKNGAGKSTLLKILSKITPPTNGKIISRGRIASLLEVGTGFHPELSGSENIFLNGSILGMKRSEILRKFDEIIDFSGVEKFIDTPLKHYSSGMQLRLAFAVAAFLEPEILIIDEVLAVGDAEFQKKCMGKMHEVSKSGRTILFVSHNIEALRNICSKGLVFNKGRNTYQGEINRSIEEYFNLNSIKTDHKPLSKIIKSIELFCDNIPTEEFYSGSKFELKVSFRNNSILHFPILGVIIKDAYNTPLLGVNNKNYGYVTTPATSGIFSFSIPNLPLFEGIYSIDLRLGDGYKELEIVEDAIRFNVNLSSKIKGMEKPINSLNKIYLDSAQFELTVLNQ